MIDPSGIRLPAGEKFRLKEVKKGLFIVENAFEGDYEYFDGRPMFKVKRSTEQVGLDSIFDHAPPAVATDLVPSAEPLETED